MDSDNKQIDLNDLNINSSDMNSIGSEANINNIIFLNSAFTFGDPQPLKSSLTGTNSIPSYNNSIQSYNYNYEY